MQSPKHLNLTKLELSEQTQCLPGMGRYARWNTWAIAVLEAQRRTRRRIYSLTLRLQILRLDLRSFLRHICIVFSKALYAVPPNLALGLLSVSNEHHPCQIWRDARMCGICSLLSYYPKASFHDARLFLAGFLAADGRSLEEVRDIRDFCRKQQAHRECEP